MTGLSQHLHTSSTSSLHPPNLGHLGVYRDESTYGMVAKKSIWCTYKYISILHRPASLYRRHISLHTLSLCFLSDTLPAATHTHASIPRQQITPKKTERNKEKQKLYLKQSVRLRQQEAAEYGTTAGRRFLHKTRPTSWRERVYYCSTR